MNTKLIKILNLSHFTVDFYSAFLIPLLPIIALKQNFSVLEMSIIMSFSYFLSSILQPLWGYIADKQSKYYFTMLGLIITAFGIISLMLVNNVYLTILLILFANFGEGIYHPQATGLVTQLSNKTTNKNLGMFLALGSLGFAVGPLFSGYITDSKSIEWIWLISLWAVVISLITLINLYPQNNTTKNDADFAFFKEVKNIFLNKELRKLINIGFIRPLILVSFCIFLPFKWQLLGYSSLKTGILLGLFSFTGALGAYLGGYLFSKYENKRNIIANTTLILTTLCGFTYLQLIEKDIAIIFFLLTSFFVNQIGSINLSIAHKLIPNNKSSISGIINGYNWGLVGMSLWITGFFIAKFDYIVVLCTILLIPLTSINKIKNN